MMTDAKPVSSLDDDWCSIDEAARRLGVTATAIRNRIKRGTLEDLPNGNFGRLVRVPLPVPGTVTLTPGGPATSTVTEIVSILTRHIERLEAQLEAALKRAADRDRIEAERNALAARLDALKTVLEIEKQRVVELQFNRDGLHADRDRWAAQSERLAIAKLAAAPQLNSLRPWWLWRRSA
jgi:hypothetical protein